MADEDEICDDCRCLKRYCRCWTDPRPLPRKSPLAGTLTLVVGGFLAFFLALFASQHVAELVAVGALSWLVALVVCVARLVHAWRLGDDVGGPVRWRPKRLAAPTDLPDFSDSPRSA